MILAGLCNFGPFIYYYMIYSGLLILEFIYHLCFVSSWKKDSGKIQKKQDRKKNCLIANLSSIILCDPIENAAESYS
jgi:hypothetical protein